MTADKSQKHNSENDFIATKIVIDIAISGANDTENFDDSNGNTVASISSANDTEKYCNLLFSLIREQCRKADSAMIIIHPGIKNNVAVIFNQEVDSSEKMVERDFIVCCIE